MAEKTEGEPLHDFDDLLQCPVCYEIPPAQIYQCDQGHHVCGSCKARLNECPVCRAMFFGTRNYGMEALIANIRKLQASKSAVKRTIAPDSTVKNTSTVTNSHAGNNAVGTSSQTLRAPPACKGLFRCLCCLNGNSEKLPAARLLNHLRYFHSAELIEGNSEGGEYLQAWQISTALRKLVTAIRVKEMGIFFLSIEMDYDSVCAWLSMASSAHIAEGFNYTVTISGCDREAIFTDAVWSVRSCEGKLKKNGRCFLLNGDEARALIAPATVNCKLLIRRLSEESQSQQPQSQPRVVLRVASRSTAVDESSTDSSASNPTVESTSQQSRDDVVRPSPSSEQEARPQQPVRLENGSSGNGSVEVNDNSNQPTERDQPDDQNTLGMSRRARRRLRQRMRNLLNTNQVPVDRSVSELITQPPMSLQNNDEYDDSVLYFIQQINPGSRFSPSTSHLLTAPGGASSESVQNGHNIRSNKKRRRHRR